MARKIRHEGQVYSFPDDASDDEVLDFLEGQAAPKTTPLSELSLKPEVEAGLPTGSIPFDTGGPVDKERMGAVNEWLVRQGKEPLGEPNIPYGQGPQEPQSGIVRDLISGVTGALLDMPVRALSFAKFVVDNPAVTIKAGFTGRNDDLQQQLDMLTEDERKQVVGGAIDSALMMAAPVAKAGAAGLTGMSQALPLIGETAMWAKKGPAIIKGLIYGAHGGAMFPSPDRADELGERTESAAIGALFGGAISPLFARMAASPAGARKIQQSAEESLKYVPVEKVMGETGVTRGLIDDAADDVMASVVKSRGNVHQTIREMMASMPARARAATQQLDEIATTGTIQPKAIRETLTNLSGKIDPGDVVINERLVEEARNEMVFHGRVFVGHLNKIISERGNAFEETQFRNIIREYLEAESRWFQSRAVWGRTGHQF